MEVMELGIYVLLLRFDLNVRVVFFCLYSSHLWDYFSNCYDLFFIYPNCLAASI